MTIWRERTPCWSVACDRCGESAVHFDTREELIDELTACGWWFHEDGSVLCAMCALEAFQSMSALRAAWLN